MPLEDKVLALEGSRSYKYSVLSDFLLELARQSSMYRDFGYKQGYSKVSRNELNLLAGGDDYSRLNTAALSPARGSAPIG